MPFARGERPLAQKILRRDLARHRDGRRPASLRRRPWPAGERAIHFGGIVAHAFDGVALLGERAAEELLFRSEEHTSELQSLMRISYAVFCLKKKNHHIVKNTTN